MINLLETMGKFSKDEARIFAYLVSLIDKNKVNKLQYAIPISEMTRGWINDPDKEPNKLFELLDGLQSKHFLKIKTEGKWEYINVNNEELNKSFALIDELPHNQTLKIKMKDKDGSLKDYLTFKFISSTEYQRGNPFIVFYIPYAALPYMLYLKKTYAKNVLETALNIDDADLRILYCEEMKNKEISKVFYYDNNNPRIKLKTSVGKLLDVISLKIFELNRSNKGLHLVTQVNIELAEYMNLCGIAQTSKDAAMLHFIRDLENIYNMSIEFEWLNEDGEDDFDKNRLCSSIDFKDGFVIINLTPSFVEYIISLYDYFGCGNQVFRRCSLSDSGN